MAVIKAQGDRRGYDALRTHILINAAEMRLVQQGITFFALVLLFLVSMRGA